jgi:hypothetical protein
MKNFTILVTIVTLGFVSCTVDRDLEPSFKNEIEQFSFIKMKILGKEVNKNLSMYNSGWAHRRWDYSNGWINRNFSYVGNTRRVSPYTDYFDDVSFLEMDWETRNSRTPSQLAGGKYPISPRQYRDNHITISFSYSDIPLQYEYRSQDSVLYIDAKDTLIDGRLYELTHLYFDELEFRDDSGSSIMVEDVELRQVVYINEW